MASDPQLGNGGRSRPARRDDGANTIVYGPLDKPPGGFDAFLDRAMPVIVCIAIALLGYGSQWLFSYAAFFIGPGTLTPGQAVIFNASLLCLWYCFFKACTTHPGKITYKPPTSPPPSRSESSSSAASLSSAASFRSASAVSSSSSSSSSLWAPSWVDNPSDKAILRSLRRKYPGTRWCDKCSAPKPARAYHCRVCRHCVPRMDHHCPWIGNCVSLTTFPHFLRFLVWAEVSLSILGTHYWERLKLLFSVQHALMVTRSEHVAVFLLLGLMCLWFVMLIFVSVMILSTVWDWVQNQTTIESRQIGRHARAMRRRREKGGEWWDDSQDSGCLESDCQDEDEDGNLMRRHKRAPPGKVVFPYEISFFTNMSQAMGTRNFLLWLWPFAESPELDSDGSDTGVGWRWEENGFNDAQGMWPPPQAQPQPYGRGRGGPTRRHHHGGHGRGGGASKYSWPGSRENRAHEDEDENRGLLADLTSAEQQKTALRARQEVDINAIQDRAKGGRERKEIIGGLEEDDDDDEDIPLGELIRRRK